MAVRHVRDFVAAWSAARRANPPRARENDDTILTHYAADLTLMNERHLLILLTGTLLSCSGDDGQIVPPDAAKPADMRTGDAGTLDDMRPRDAASGADAARRADALISRDLGVDMQSVDQSPDADAGIETVCGNGVREGTEACDGGDVPADTCVGWTGGGTCSTGCTIEPCRGVATIATSQTTYTGSSPFAIQSVSANGERLSFTVAVGDGEDFYSLNMLDGALSEVATDTDVDSTRISKNGLHLWFHEWLGSDYVWSEGAATATELVPESVHDADTFVGDDGTVALLQQVGFQENQYELHIHLPNGGTQLVLTDVFRGSGFRISRDQRYLAARTQAAYQGPTSIRVVDLGTATVLHTAPGETNPRTFETPGRFGPRSERFVFDTDDGFSVWLAANNTTSDAPMPGGDWLATEVSESSNHLAYAAAGAAWLWDPVAGTHVALPDGSGDEFAFDHAGARVAYFEADAIQNASTLLLYDIAAMSSSPLAMEVDVDPVSFSPDDELLAFLNPPGQVGPHEVEIYDLASDTTTRLPTVDPNNLLWNPSSDGLLFEDGSTLAYWKRGAAAHVTIVDLPARYFAINGTWDRIGGVGGIPARLQVLDTAAQVVTPLSTAGNSVTAVWKGDSRWLAGTSGRIVECQNCGSPRYLFWHEAGREPPLRFVDLQTGVVDDVPTSPGAIVGASWTLAAGDGGVVFVEATQTGPNFNDPVQWELLLFRP